MINLLPPETKDDIALSRHNFMLFKISIVLLGSILGMLLITQGGVFYMKQSKTAYAAQVQGSKEAIKSQNLESVQTKVEEISGNIKLTTDVLSREILFSKLLKQIGAVMPANTSLSDLKISKTERSVVLTAVASDYNTGTQIQVNLADPANKIFDKADIINITCSDAATDPRYPCTVIIRTQFSDNKSYLFIAPEGPKS